MVIRLPFRPNLTGDAERSTRLHSLMPVYAEVEDLLRNDTFFFAQDWRYLGSVQDDIQEAAPWQ